MSILNNRKTIFSLAIGLGTFVAAPAFAGCYFVACPNQAQPPVYQAPTSNNGYEQGYNEGLAAGKASAKTKVVYVKTSSKAKKASFKKSAIKKSYAAKKTVKKSAHKTYTSKTYKPKTTNYASNGKTYYSQPIVNHAATYGTNSYGASVPVSAYMGRGEQWVSSKVTIVRYSTPTSFSYQNGRACGWGTPIASNGQYGNSRAWVCQCEQGWLPPR